MLFGILFWPTLYGSLADQHVTGLNPSRPAVAGQVVNTCASVTKQYNLVPANGQWCLAAGKVTIDLALHWPHVIDISGSPPTGSRPWRGKWAPAYALLWSMVDFTLPLPVLCICMYCRWTVRALWMQITTRLLQCSSRPVMTSPWWLPGQRVRPITLYVFPVVVATCRRCY